MDNRKVSSMSLVKLNHLSQICLWIGSRKAESNHIITKYYGAPPSPEKDSWKKKLKFGEHLPQFQKKRVIVQPLSI